MKFDTEVMPFKGPAILFNPTASTILKVLRLNGVR
jgi:hypothetical protein